MGRLSLAFVSSGAKGRYGGSKKIGNGIWNVYYRNVLLGYVDAKEFKKKQHHLKVSRIKV